MSARRALFNLFVLSAASNGRPSPAARPLSAIWLSPPGRGRDLKHRDGLACGRPRSAIADDTFMAACCSLVPGPAVAWPGPSVLSKAAGARGRAAALERVECQRYEPPLGVWGVGAGDVHDGGVGDQEKQQVLAGEVLAQPTALARSTSSTTRSLARRRTRSTCSPAGSVMDSRSARPRSPA